ncbi:uncharacterized protein LOC135682455 [Rhopilema esculentum]|uniref:uncharacterized protein LOC135682455 n=1 Tax=Rhopilema esculentum TaxID=499914 RepID=UPI0031D31503
MKKHSSVAKAYIMSIKAVILSISVGCNLATILRESCQYYGDFNIVLQDMAVTGNVLKSFVGKTKRQCTLECMSSLECQSLNFKEDDGQCELLDRNLTSSMTAISKRLGWVYMTTDEEASNVGPRCALLSPCRNGGKCVDTCTEDGFKCQCKEMFTGKYCENERSFASCQAAYIAGYRKDGVYLLSNIGHHYCVLNRTTNCDGVGGWTLVLKTDGRLNTFRYESSHWTSSSVYNHVYALTEGFLGDQEAKFPAFNALPFTRVCVGMRSGSEKSYITLGHRSTSLLTYFQGSFKATDQLSNWRNLLKGSQLQPYCNRQGFNNVITGSVDARVRIGILGNNENDCITPDSAIGIGIGGSHLQPTGVYTGATMSAQKVFAYILIK